MELIDIRSDTVTVPTEAMRKAMSEAVVGDDVYGQDPTVNKLQEVVAQMFGKQAALFTPSGLMSNQLSIMSWTEPGNQIIIWENAHIIDHETCALTILSAVQARQISSKSGIITPQQIEPLIRKDQGILYPQTALICLQNSLSNGRVWPLQSLKAVRQLANKYGLKIHIDGARIFNAATSSNCHVREIVKYADSVSFCLSKGLCCPIGSLIVGPKDMILRARAFRKSIGGGLRQSGILAAAGLVALEQIIPQLSEDHRIAKWIGLELSKIPQISVEHQNLEANMVFFRVDQSHPVKAPQFIEHLLKRGIKMNEPYEPFFNYRIAVHFYVRQKQAERIVSAIRQLF